MTLELVERGPVRVYSPGVARAMLRRESQARSVGERLRALQRDSELEKRRAAGLSLSTGLSLSAQSGPVFNGRFISIFPNAYQVVQTDVGLTYGGTLLAAGTSPPVITLTGTLVGAPVPILVTETFPGILGTWTGSVSYDNGGSVAQTFTSAATVPLSLTGKGAGLTLNIAAGASATGNTWQATAAGLLDQSGNGKHYTQAAPSLQPIITVGYNGKPGLLFDGVDDIMASTVGSLLGLASVTPYLILAIARRLSSAVNQGLLGSALSGVIYAPVTGQVGMYNGASGPQIAFAASALTRFAAKFTGSASDTLKVGSVTLATGNAGNTASATTRNIGSLGTSQVGNVEILAVIYVPPTSLATFDAAVNSAPGYGVGNVSV